MPTLTIKLLTVALTVTSLAWAEAPQTQSDFAFHKSLHVLGGAGTSLIVGTATSRPWVGLAAGIGAGIAKEGYDKGQGGSFSGRDVLITSGGAAVGYILNKYAFHIHRKK
jgi:hypothetical protein